MRKWPDVLPGASFPGYGLTTNSKVRRTDMEAGEPRARRITRARGDVISASWIFADAEMGAFRSWFDDLAVSVLGDSDDLTGWGSTATTISALSVTGPDNCLPTLLVPTTASSAHSIGQVPAALAIDNTAVVGTVTLSAAGLTKARVLWVNRAGVSTFADIDLTTGLIIGSPGFPVTVIDRGAGWWRITADLNTGAGASTPAFRILALDASGANVFPGNGADGIAACEVMLRKFTTPADRLFVRSGSDGKALGADGGAGWFQMKVPVGGGFTLQDCRFVDTFDGQAGPNIEWTVKAKVELRYA